MGVRMGLNSPTILVEKFISTSYDTVKVVADNLTTVEAVGNKLTEIQAVADNTAALLALEPTLNNIVTTGTSTLNNTITTGTTALDSTITTGTSTLNAIATNSATSATAAASSATNAQTSLISSQGVLASAQTSAAAALVSQNATAATFENFDETYLGAKNSVPTLDNNGAALEIGALYFLIGTGIQVYNGTTWSSLVVADTYTRDQADNKYIASAGSTPFTTADHDRLDKYGLIASTGITNPVLHTFILEIGSWNMDSTMSKSVSTVNLTDGYNTTRIIPINFINQNMNIRSVSVMIQDDNQSFLSCFATDNGMNSANMGKVIRLHSTYIELTRALSDHFNAPLWSNTSINRGWITLQYVSDVVPSYATP